MSEDEEGERNGGFGAADVAEAGGCCLIELLVGLAVLIGVMITPVLLPR